MKPVQITTGKLFKGLSQYLSHDEQEARAERVGWTQTYSLADAPPAQAWRLMLATANSSADLKEAAGIKKGKTPKNVVHQFSINFNPEDEVRFAANGNSMPLTAKKLCLGGAIKIDHSKGQAKEAEILMIDYLSPISATVKIRIRAHRHVFLDHLGFVNGAEGWQIVSKIWHLETTLDEAA